VMDCKRLLGKASHNPVLELVIDTVASLMEDVLERLKLPTKIDLVAPRRKIVAKLRARDAEAAKHELSRHLEQTTSYVLEQATRPLGEGDHALD